MNIKDLPDYPYLQYFLCQNDLHDYMSGRVITNTKTDVCLCLYFAGDDLIELVIHRCEDGTYQITSMR